MLGCVVSISWLRAVVVYQSYIAIVPNIIMENSRNIFKSIQLPGSKPGDPNWETASWGYSDWNSLFDSCFGDSKNEEQSAVTMINNDKDTVIDINSLDCMKAYRNEPKQK